MCPVTVWIISGLRSRRKNVTAPAPELFFSLTRLQLRSQRGPKIFLGGLKCFILDE